MRPNVLWYCTDQQRHDTVGALGNACIRTPAIDRLAARGRAFTHAFAQSPVCTPSRASFMTGRYPASHHVHRNGNARFPASETLVTRLFADAGWRAGLIGKLHLAAAVADTEPRTDDGYTYFAWSHHPYPPRPVTDAYHRWLRDRGVDPVVLYARHPGFCGAGVPADLHQTTWATDEAIRFVDGSADASWFLSVNVFDPHPPFDPPPEALARLGGRDLPPPAFRASDIDRQRRFAAIPQQSAQASRPWLDAERPPPEGAGDALLRWAHRPPSHFHGLDVKAAYYAMIEHVDREFGRLLAALDDRGQLERTIVVYTSDHGEMLGDHGLLYKGCRFFEPLVRVPLVMAGPGVRASTPSDALVELVDIAPTLLDLCGLPVPARMQGCSMCALLDGRDDWSKRHVIAEYNDALGSVEHARPVHASMYRDGTHKIVVYHGEGLGELYDLREDPREFDDLWDSPAHAGLRAQLIARHFDAMMATSDAGIARVGMG